jgi:hypothetical protein
VSEGCCVVEEEKRKGGSVFGEDVLLLCKSEEWSILVRKGLRAVIFECINQGSQLQKEKVSIFHEKPRSRPYFG